jgi:CTP:molybdopterin cytidylyltransferase MocA
MRRVLLVPAAGLGSRLQVHGAKALVAVNGRPMLDHIADLYQPYVNRLIVVTHPSFAPAISEWAGSRGGTHVVEQPAPTGMLDAILLAAPAVARERPDAVWITWCDQVGVLPRTVARLAAEEGRRPAPALVGPTVRRAHPYIHFVRDAAERIIAVRHRREGDQMPDEGESDMGLFALTRDTYDRLLVEYAATVVPGRATAERNFLPFIAWLAGRAPVATIPCTDPMEAVGINTPEELRQVEGWLRTRGAPEP